MSDLGWWIILVVGYLFVFALWRLADRMSQLPPSSSRPLSRVQRKRDAEFDELIVSTENPAYFLHRGEWPVTLAAQEVYHRWLDEQGLLEPGEPTPYSHATYEREMTAPFSPDERRMIRADLGMKP